MNKDVIEIYHKNMRPNKKKIVTNCERKHRKNVAKSKKQKLLRKKQNGSRYLYPKLRKVGLILKYK